MRDRRKECIECGTMCWGKYSLCSKCSHRFGMRSGYSKDQIVEFIKDSISVSEVLEKIGLSQKGGNYKTFHKFVKEYGIDTSHFLGQAIHKGKRFRTKKRYTRLPKQRV